MYVYLLLFKQKKAKVVLNPYGAFGKLVSWSFISVID